ncbi:hypothetical protein [Aquibium microcysteis]|uniref:hypothetical protein n=1 Tax=Aquibium microcysteis TaxID=675281 RepID=UPI00165CF584|nr:hypothetical protein [Aquibium microcysteis]
MTFAPRSLAIAMLAAAVALPAGADARAGSVPHAKGAPLLALSEIGQAPAASEEDAADETAPVERGVPLPDPVLRLPLPAVPAVPPSPADDAPAGTGEPEQPDDGEAADETLPEVVYDYSLLPDEVRRMRELILEACRSGDPERLRPLIGIGDGATQISFGDAGDDPIAHLIEMSGDERGQEILAILLEILEAGYVHLSPGTPGEIYVFPYFFGLPLERLTDPQRVELFKIVTAGDVEEMKLYGSYTFYRAGFSPEGRWLFFVAGD